ncbi:response regulator [Saccharophagus degradans]|uniref:Response regulator receiver n=1 Tax=Saccharophagus degradans (strain 2-40 / ATCC 43961 / DSM 17024) TaxID=203122 RepID=Q21N04_SACD2|nr:response regulator [Saccharophagus degradans]ABD79925.1 response regulator receiver [Saccharophagus degradans 2-40]WGO97911.1 response regulator [Saccharophagus degradans]
MSVDKRFVVLIVDDDADDVFLARAAAQQAGIPVELISVENGDELYGFLNQKGRYAGVRRPDLILLDLNMPVIDGRQVLQELKQPDGEFRSIPIVVHTTSGSPDDVKFCYEAGANSYLVKSADFNQLKSAMDNLLKYWFVTVYHP